MAIFREIKWKVRRIIRKLKIVYKWIPVLMQDEDWDYFYIYTILQRKLEFAREHMLNHGYHEDNKHIASRMQTAINLIEVVKTEKYINDVMLEMCGKEGYKIVDKAYKKHERAKNLLFKFLNHNLHNWWD